VCITHSSQFCLSHALADLTEPDGMSGSAHVLFPGNQSDIFTQLNCTQQAVQRSGFVSSNPRQHNNLVTSLIDGSGTFHHGLNRLSLLSAFFLGSSCDCFTMHGPSAVYGSNEALARELRTLKGGKMKTSNKGQLLPLNVNGFPNGKPYLVLSKTEGTTYAT
jgi:hypothetical protein